jgi:hypothetical protein
VLQAEKITMDGLATFRVQGPRLAASVHLESVSQTSQQKRSVYLYHLITFALVTYNDSC